MQNAARHHHHHHNLRIIGPYVVFQPGIAKILQKITIRSNLSWNSKTKELCGVTYGNGRLACDKVSRPTRNKTHHTPHTLSDKTSFH